MTLPSSGSLSYNSIRAEFGSPSTNVYLSLYYRRGPYCYNLPQNSSITTGSSSTISVANFYGAEGPARYASGTGGTYNTGGKLPSLQYGTGGPGLPAMSDTSINVGGTQRTCVSFYYFTGILNGVNIGLPQGHFGSMNSRTWRVYYDSNFSNFYNGTMSPNSSPGFSGTNYLSWLDAPGGGTWSWPTGTSLNSGQRNLYRAF